MISLIWVLFKLYCFKILITDSGFLVDLRDGTLLKVVMAASFVKPTEVIKKFTRLLKWGFGASFGFEDEIEKYLR